MFGPIFVGCGLADLLTGNTTLVVGIEETEDGLKVYVGSRWKNKYLLIEDAKDQDTVRRAWHSGGKVLLPLPNKDQVFTDPVG